MPQMSFMLWLNLYFYFIIMFLSISLLLFYPIMFKSFKKDLIKKIIYYKLFW